jgi:hypothetical protein
MKGRALLLATAALLAGSLPPNAWSAGLSVVPNGDRGVLLVSAGLSGAPGASVTFDYDQTLGEPWISIQGGNLSSPVQISQGRVSIAIDRDDPDAAIELDVRFESPGDMSRAISNIAAASSDGAGSLTPVPVEYGRPDLEADPVPEPVDGAREATLSRGGDSQLRPGAVPVAGEGADSGSAAAAQAPPEEKGRGDRPETRQGSAGVLQLFERFSGAPGLEAFSRLFALGRAPGLHQEPAVAISDGSSLVRLNLKAVAQGDRAPNFALTGAELVGLEKGPGGSWSVTVLVQAGVHEASLLLTGANGTLSYPLVVVPRLPGLPAAPVQAGSFVAELNRCLAAGCGQAGEAPPRYLCEYIFTGNVLAQVR